MKFRYFILNEKNQSIEASATLKNESAAAEWFKNHPNNDDLVLVAEHQAYRQSKIAAPSDDWDKKNADRIDGYDRDDLGENPDY